MEAPVKPLEELAAADVPVIRTSAPGPRAVAVWAAQAPHNSPGLSGAAQSSRLVMAEGRGALVQDVDGNVFIDFCAGTVVNVTGHNHPKVRQAIQEELDHFIHVYDFLTPVRAEFFQKLAEQLPPSLSAFQMYTSGSETVEAALRVAGAASGGKREYISFYRAFHGKTAGTRALLGGMYKKGFGPGMAGYIQSPNAYCYRCPLGLTYPGCGVACADMIEHVYNEQSTGDVAAVLIEPIQGAGGVIVPPREFIEKIRQFCDAKGIFLIFDEVLSAAGRTGKMWAKDHFGVTPDVMTMGKGIGSGYPVGVVASSQEMFDHWPFNQPGGGSTTFGGSGAAAAAGLATLKVLVEENLVENGARVGAHIKRRLQAMQQRHRIIGDVRGEGMLIGVEWVSNPDTRAPLAANICLDLFMETLRRGVLLVTTGQIWRITPPLVMTEALADRALDLIEDAVSSVEQKHHL